MLYSKKMLHVVETALDMLEVVNDSSQVEVLWLSAITGLRAIGHILDKTDKPNNPELAPKIDQWWRDLKNSKSKSMNNIFFDFIDAERNDTIKEFCLHYSKQPQNVVIFNPNLEDTQSFILDDLLFIPMVNRRYYGEDIRDLISEAIKWWNEQFDLMGI